MDLGQAWWIYETEFYCVILSHGHLNQNNESYRNPNPHLDFEGIEL
jgi:hypothetical protein